jgi:ferric-dicitrate binding protein FerR (iron transport regulator)
MNTPWELLAKYLTNEATEAERAEVEKWSQSREDNSLLLEKLNFLFKKNPQSFKADFKKFKDQDWETLYHKTIASGTKKVTWPTVWKLAAAISFIIVALTSILFFTRREPLLEVATTDYTREVWLPDSSYVLLNKNSKLTVASDYLSDNRKVSLIGEGFFKVKSNPESPFSVSSYKVSTTVLGTQFNVSARTDSSITVSVLEGKVRVAAKDDQHVLTANTSASYNGDALQLLASADLNYLAWKTGVIRFRSQSLQEAIRFISSHYEQPIILASSVDPDILITVELNNLSIDQALEIITATLDLQLKKETKGYVIQ